MTKSEVLILIPVFNEARVIGQVIKNLRQAGWKHLLVIDDGSTDSTARQAKKAGAKVLSHAQNLGKGAALKTGFAAALKIQPKIVITFDGDGQHQPNKLSDMVELAESFQVVLGYRDFEKSDMPRYKIWANYLANWVTGWLYGIWVKDSQSGLRAYQLAALNKLQLHHDRYEVESELIGQIKHQNLTWTELKIRATYGKYDQTKSTQQTLVTALKTMLSLIFKH